MRTEKAFQRETSVCKYPQAEGVGRVEEPGEGRSVWQECGELHGADRR